MLKLALQLTTLIGVTIFLILMGLGIHWQLAMLRALAAYLGLMILFYIAILILSILIGRRIHTDDKKTAESQS